MGSCLPVQLNKLAGVLWMACLCFPCIWTWFGLLRILSGSEDLSSSPQACMSSVLHKGLFLLTLYSFNLLLKSTKRRDTEKFQVFRGRPKKFKTGCSSARPE